MASKKEKTIELLTPLVKMGFWRFVFQRGVLWMGIPGFFINFAMLQLLTSQDKKDSALLSIILFPIVSTITAAIQWLWYRRKLNSNQ